MSSNENQSLIPHSSNEIQQSVDSFTTGLTRYLESLSLPSDRVLVQVSERNRVIINLPDVVNLLGEEARRNAIYISKFIAACGAGLFDAALNFMWDETVSNLRSKVARLDLEYFFSSVVTDPNRRARFSAADDLTKLDDWELIRGCHLTGVLSDIGFQHLDYIRNMRNWASAAHPNQNELTGLQLVSWLETCIREVIAREPSGPAIEIRRLLNNIRTETLTANDVAPISSSIELLPPDLATSLLRTIFGMYTDPLMSATAKNNIKLIARYVWDMAPEASRHDLGLRYSTFAANADIPRRDAAREFLVIVNGLSYLPPDTLALELDEKIQNLFTAHIGWYNFYNEVAHAKILAAYIPSTGVVPDAVRTSYVKTIIMCRIGNGYGVSRDAQPYYDQLIDKFQEAEIREVGRLVTDQDVMSRLQFSNCAQNYRAICQRLRARTANQRTAAILDHILSATDFQLPRIGKTPDTRRLLGME